MSFHPSQIFQLNHLLKACKINLSLKFKINLWRNQVPGPNISP